MLICFVVYLTYFTGSECTTFNRPVDKYMRTKNVVRSDIYDDMLCSVPKNKLDLIFSPLDKLVAKKSKEVQEYIKAIKATYTAYDRSMKDFIET